MKNRGNMVRDALVASSVLAGLSAVVDPVHALLGQMAPHPVWLAVLLVAGRHGYRGLLWGPPVAAGVLLLVAVALGNPLGSIPSRLGLASTLLMGGAAGMVAWLSSTNLRRLTQLRGRCALLTEHAQRDRQTIQELRGLLDTPTHHAAELEFCWLQGERSLASAMDLAMERSGARCCAVLVPIPEGFRCKQIRGSWFSDGDTPPEVIQDQTARTALRSQQAVRSVDLPPGGPTHCDMAAPVLNATGATVGVMVLRSLPHGMATLSVLHDLALLARWCGQGIGSGRSPDVLAQEDGLRSPSTRPMDG